MSKDTGKEKENKKNKAEKEKAEAAQQQTEAAEQENGEPVTGSEEAASAEQVEEVILTKADADKIAAALAESEDKYKRMLAEYDNYRKRTAAEKDGIYADAYADALKELLPIFDNLERAAAYEDGAKVAEGVKITLNQFKSALAKMNIEEYGEPGDHFDPEIHNALMHVEDDSLGEEVITEVFSKGYRRGDRILRFAMVKVAN